jgi:hypothetical protein
MKYKNGKVYFKSEGAYYKKEKSGRKNNTVRILSENEYDIVQYSLVESIEITNLDNLESFEREVTDISRVGTMCGNVIAVFTWKI